MKSVNSRIKQALKGFTTQRKGRILVNGNYYEVYNVEYYADCYDEGKVIGNAIASQLDFDLPYMPKFDTFKYYDGVWTGSSYEYVDMGTFNVFDEKDQDEFNKHITAFDNLIKFNVPFEEIGTYPKTLYAELQNICNQAGVTLGNLSIPNGSFIIENNQYVNGESLKTVLKQICGISGNYAIMKDNTLYLQLKNTTDEVLDKYQHTPTDWKRRSYGINQVIIGDSQVEGEYVIREDAEDIELNGVHKLEVLDNLFAYTQDKRDALIDALWNQVRGFGYVPYETSGEWLNYLEIGDTITIDNVETILLRINAKSPKAVESTISAPAIIDSSIEYVDNTNDIKNQLRRTEVKVDKQNQTIELLASEVEETQEIVEIISTPIEEQTEMPMYIENAEGGKLIDLKLYGDTYQETYSGKNLFKPFSYTSTSATVVFTYALDGSINCNGTASSTAYSMTTGNATPYLITLPAGTYTISGGISSDVRIEVVNSSGTSVGNTNNNPTFTLSSQTDVFIRVRVQSGTATSNVKVYPQLEKNSTATDYEPYVGGIPSPNPDYPQAVQTVTGRQDIYVCGKNLFDNIVSVTGWNFTVGNIITRNTNTNQLGCDNPIIVEPNTNYVFSLNGVTYDDTIRFIFTDNQNIVLSTETTTDGKITTPSNCTKMYFHSTALKTDYGTTLPNPMIEKNLQATEFEPYEGTTYEINLGKNLFDKNNANILNNCTINSSTKLIETNNQYKMLYIPCLPNTTYTISKVQSGYLTAGYTDTTPALGVYVNGYVASSNTTKCTITTNSTANYIVLRYYRSNDTLTEQEIRYTIQIEKGSSVSPYSAYKTPIELCKVGTYQDSIKKSTGKNLFDGLIENGGLDINTGLPVDNNTRTRSVNFIKVKPNTKYSITRKVGDHRWVLGYKADGQVISDGSISGNPTGLIHLQPSELSGTFTTTPTTEYIKWYDTNSTNVTEQVQIELGDTPTDIEPYGVGKWYVSKKIGKITLDGSETGWAKSGVNYVIAKNTIPNSNLPAQTTNLYCNYFKVYATTSQVGTLRIGSSNLVFNYDNSGNYIDDFKTWLGTHNTEVYYQLATPTAEEITDEELINQLNAIELFEGINNVSIDSGDLTADVYMKYYLKTPLSGTYVKTEELNAKLTITTEQITSEVSVKYETKTDATSKLNTAKSYADDVGTSAETNAKGYTDGQLVNYSTTTEMNSAINQKANEITTSVSTTYITKTESATNISNAKDEAIASSNNTTDDKLSSYATKTEMSTSISQTSDTINARVDKLYTNINEDTGEVESVTTTTGYKFDENGLSISRSDSEFSALHNNTGTYYKDNDAIVSQTTKDGTITKDMVLYGRYYYGVDNDLDVENFTKDDAMFIAEMYEDGNGEVGFGHFLNNLGGN